jgi:hypothetical protein
MPSYWIAYFAITWYLYSKYSFGLQNSFLDESYAFNHRSLQRLWLQILLRVEVEVESYNIDMVFFTTTSTYWYCPKNRLSLSFGFLWVMYNGSTNGLFYHGDK